jgi:G3E family GTPase
LSPHPFGLLPQNKPPSEVWCIIVNEFGAVGLDAVAIEASCTDGSAVVKQLAGGCMCCVLSGPLSAAIAQIIRQAKPDRVIIEPSGLGHPGGEFPVAVACKVLVFRGVQRSNV